MERWRRFQIRSREVWDVELSYTGEGVGYEEQFRHPCIVIRYNKFVDLVTIIPLSSNIKALKDFPHTYIINPTSSNGLTRQSIAMIYQIRSLSKQRFIRNRGRVSRTDYDRIQILLKDYFQLS
ncbi:MAG: type II toxin-antitoxin system PemK/MazF family toxin [Candidatus Lokiarchaeota archaeon]|nr:type II toxin-antitoxin system PemK/MazF family toxin [Candidatus Lokiarchaeota archaeon]